MVLVVTTIIFCFWKLEPSPARGSSTVPQNTLVPNGGVNAMGIGSDGTVYIGGSFTRVGPNMGYGIPISASTGLAAATFPIVNNTVLAVAADGSNGWYIGGTFTQVGSFTRNGLAHILANGTVDSAWNPNANGTINAMAVSGTTIYIGGGFTTMGGATRNHAAAIGADGTLLSWNPNANNTVNAMTISGSTIYIGGVFGFVGGVARNRVAAIGSDGTLLPWNPNVNSTVNALGISGSTIYVGGSFTTIGGVTRNRLGAIGTDGTLQSWDPKPNNDIYAMAVSGTTVYVGGALTSVSSTSRIRVAAIGTDGILQAWNPSASFPVYSIALSDTAVYLGGDFATTGGATRNFLAAIGFNGVAQAWNPNPGGRVSALAVAGGSVYAGGTLYFLGGTIRNNAFALASDGTLRAWNPNIDNTINALVVTGTTVYVGGSFASSGVTSRLRLAAIGTDGTLLSWNPVVVGGINTLTVSGSAIYAGGSFTSINGIARNNLGAIGSDGTLQPWNPNANGNVFTLMASGTTIYAGGTFTSMSSSTRNRVAAIGTDGTLQSWNPNITGTNVSALAASGTAVYIGGSFTAISGVARTSIGGVNSDGALLSWAPSLGGLDSVMALFSLGSSVYVGGTLMTVNTTTRNLIAEIGSDGTLLPWDAGIPYDVRFTSTNQVRAIAATGTTLYVGGLFNFLSGSSTPSFVRYDISQNPLPSISTISPTFATVGDPTLTLTVNGTGFVSSSVVRWNGSVRTTTFVTSTQLTAVIPSSDLGATGTASVTVFSPAPGGGTSTAQIFTIQNPAPTVASISPSVAVVGSSSTILTVRGTGFIPSSVIQWNGVTRTTTYVSSTEMTALIPVSDFAVAGTANVTVVTPAPGGGTSVSRVFTIENSVPVSVSLSPTFATVGDGALILIVTGSGFAPGSEVRWNGIARATTFVSSTQVSAVIPASDFESAGAVNVTVFSPAPGGGTSTAQTFTIQNPAPILASISPSVAPVGSSSIILRVSGTGFVPSSVIQWNGAARSTTYVSSTEMTALVPASDFTVAGTVSVTVMTQAPGGGTSISRLFTVENVIPASTSLSPEFATVGDEALTLTVMGTGFVPGSEVRWNGSPRVTTFISSTEVRAAIPASDFETAGGVNVVVFSPAPGGGISIGQIFTVQNQVPTISLLMPVFATVGDASFVLTVNGTGFVSGSEVRWNGNSLPTIFYSASEVRASVPPEDLEEAELVGVTVFTPTPGGGISAERTFTVQNPAPINSSISPTSATVGDPTLTLTVNGTGFVASSVVEWNGASRATGFVSSTELTVSIPSSDLATAGTAEVTVVSPTPGGGISAAQTFTVNNPVATPNSLSPRFATVGDGSFVLTVDGIGFVLNSSVRWNGSPRPTTFVSSSRLTAIISAFDVSTAGIVIVNVFNPLPGGGTLSSQEFTVQNPIPFLSSISPVSATAGDDALMVTVHGTGFVSDSEVQSNGSSRATTFISSTQLRVTLTSADLEIAGTSEITVVSPSPGGGNSSPQTFTIQNPTPILTSMFPTLATVGDGALVVTVFGSGFVPESEVRWDGSSRSTTFVSSSEMTVLIPVSDFDVAGTADVTVYSPTIDGDDLAVAPARSVRIALADSSENGGTSESQTFTIQSPVPVISSISPESVTAGSQGLTLSVHGSGFALSSVVYWNGSIRTTAYVSAHELIVSVPASDFYTAGMYSLTVFTTGPGGGLSSAQVFTVQALPSSPSGGGGGAGGALPPVQTVPQTYSNVTGYFTAKPSRTGMLIDELFKRLNIGTPESSTVYYIGTDGLRHVFLNEKIYFTWYNDFSPIQLMEPSQLASIPLGKNVTYKPGVRMVKFTTNPKVYVVEKGRVLRWVTSEAVASALYGVHWNSFVDDISDAFYVNYSFGADVHSSMDYNPAQAAASVESPSDSLGS